VKLARQLIAWSLVKRRPWTHLLWEAATNLLPAGPSRHFASPQFEPWINKDFLKRSRRIPRRINERFGIWLPSRRAFADGLVLMMNQMAKRFSLWAGVE